MKVKDILSDVAVKIGKAELVDYWNGKSDEGEEESKELLAYYNEAEKDIALQFFPLTAQQNFFVTTGKILYSAFLTQPSSVKSVCDGQGNELEYALYASYLSVKGESVTVTYTYLPADKAIADESEVAFGVPFSALVAGVLKNYYLGRGLLAESAVWNTEYFEKMKAAERVNRKKMRMKERKWV